MVYKKKNMCYTIKMEIKSPFTAKERHGIKMTENYQNITDNKISRAERINVILAILVSFICCLAIPMASTSVIGNVVGIVTVAVCSVFAVRVSSRKILTVLALVILFSLFGLSNGLPIIAAVLAITVGCGTMSWLIVKIDSPYIAIIPVLAYAVATVISKSWFGSLLTLIFVFPAILLAQSYEKMNTRVGALLRVSIGFISFVVLAIVFSMLYFTGEFDIRIIGNILNGFKENAVKVLSSIEIALVNGQTEMLMSETDAYNYISLLISLIPALVVLLCYVLSYFSQKMQFSIFKYTDGEKEFNELRTVFVMSPFSAVAFVMSFLLYTIAITSSASSVLSTVTSNLYLIFMPGLAVMGVKSFFGGRAGAVRSGCFSFAITALFLFLLFFNTGTALVMAACFGSYAAIEGPVRKFLDKKRD